LWQLRLMTRGKLRWRRQGLRCLFLVMPTLTWARRYCACSGESWADGPAHDAKGALELDSGPGRSGRGRCGAGQRSDRVVGEFTGAHPDWLTVIQLPTTCALDLNSVEGSWANMKNGCCCRKEGVKWLAI
jgi:hypothetical protein